jgi:hypothetical protein
MFLMRLEHTRISIKVTKLMGKMLIGQKFCWYEFYVSQSMSETTGFQ